MVQYSRTIIRIDTGASAPVVLGPGVPAPPELGALLPLYVVTAWNPGDERPTDEANHAANARLRRLLEESGATHIFDAAGHDPDPAVDYCEAGFAAAGVSQAQAVELGRQFRQDAIFEITAAGHRVVPCVGV